MEHHIDDIDSALASKYREGQEDPGHQGMCDSNGYGPEHCSCGAVVIDGPNRTGNGRNRVCGATGYHLGWYDTTC
jgi:hypothetical protein